MEIEQERFEAWLFSQPTERVFVWTSVEHCAVCEFLNETQSLVATSGAWWSNLWVKQPFEAKMVARIEWPDWLNDTVKWVVHNKPELSIAHLQARYRELFPDTTPEPTPAIAEAVGK